MWIAYVLAATFCVRSAHAEGAQVALVPVTTRAEDRAGTSQLVNDVAEELEGFDAKVLRPEAMLTALRTHHARLPRGLSDSERAQIADSASEALDAASNGDGERALRALRRALELSDGALEGVNRNDNDAQKLFRVCLLAVQVLSEDGNYQAAREQALSCRVRSPDLQLPTDRPIFAPSVHRLLEEAEAQLKRGAAHPVVVDSRPGGCPVYVNGRQLGRTPYTLSTFGMGWRVQVECDGAPGLVHEIDPAARAPRIAVDGGFEAAVRDEAGALVLSYAGAGASSAPDRAPEHARALAAYIEADFVLLVGAGKGGGRRLQLVPREGAAQASVTLPAAYTHDALAGALRALLAPTSITPASVARTDAPAPSASRRRLAVWQKALGIGTIVAGAALLGASGIAYRHQRTMQRRYEDTPVLDEDFLRHGRAWGEDARRATMTLAGLGGGLTVAGAAGLALAAEPEALPWWSAIAAGAVGGGLVTWGVVNVIDGGPCPPTHEPDMRACSASLDKRDLGALLILSGAAGLATFVIKLTRGPWWATDKLTAGFGVMPGGGEFTLRGRI